MPAVPPDKLPTPLQLASPAAATARGRVWREPPVAFAPDRYPHGLNPQQTAAGGARQAAARATLLRSVASGRASPGSVGIVVEANQTVAKTARNGSRYTLQGPADAPVLALIHGLGLNRHIWQEFETRFKSRYRVLSYDLYGHGESADPPVRPSVRLYAQQLIGLMDELGIERCVAIGFSLGGMINRRMALDHPDRVSALVILNSPHERGAEAQALVEQRALDSAAGPGATLDATIERWFTAEFRNRHGDYIQQVRDWVLANDAANYVRAREVLAFGVVELIRPQPPLALPTLVMTCEHDSGSTPAMSQAIGGEIDGAAVIIVPGLKHMGLVENPGFFVNAIFEFLESVARPRTG